MKKKIIALLAVAMFTLTTRIMAAEILDLGGSFSYPIASLVNGASTNEGGGSIDVSYLNGRKLDYLYCVDLFTSVSVPATYPNTTINNSGQIYGASLVNADKVAYLLTTYGTSGQGDQAIALQAAIWHEINAPGVYDLNLSYYNANNANIATLYTKYVGEVDTHSGDVSKFTWITPGTTDVNGKLTMYQGLVTSNPVPEPSTIILLGTGMLFMAVYGKRHMNKVACTITHKASPVFPRRFCSKLRSRHDRNFVTPAIWTLLINMHQSLVL